MNFIKRIIDQKNSQNISDYFLVHRRIEEEKTKRRLNAKKTVRIAILSAFTTTGIREVLNVKCCGSGIMPEFYEAPYNQYAKEIIDKHSLLYKFNPEITIIFVDTRSLLGEAFFFPYRYSDSQRKKIMYEKYKEQLALIKTLSENMSGRIILHNFEVPLYSPWGILENKQDFGFFEMIKTLNLKLAKEFKDNARVFVFDYDSFCSKCGKRQIFNNKLYYLGDIKLDLNFIPFLGEEYMGFIKPLMSLSKKCLVLDLDNTLWGGVVGEDGFESIKLGPTPEGRPFMEFQKYILNLFERGIVLAINSRNNPEDALRVLRDHPYMVLREEHFASIQINWNDKVSNMKAIAEEINIGLDSLVFIDDDKLNREMVKNTLPEVLVVDLPDDRSDYLKTLMELNDFNVLQITNEDKKKGSMYVEQRRRDGYKKNAKDITQYLKGLDIVVKIEQANPFTIPRISQLTQKTNQFNMTTRRYLEEDIRRFANSDKYVVVSMQVEDKFGDNGIAGAAIVEKCPDRWRIDAFLLSCRILGREAEKALLAFISEEMQIQRCRKLVGEFIPTEKNKVARDFYQNNNFKLVSSKDSNPQIWELDLGCYNCVTPDFIKVVKKANVCSK